MTKSYELNANTPQHPNTNSNATNTTSIHTNTLFIDTNTPQHPNSIITDNIPMPIVKLWFCHTFTNVCGVNALIFEIVSVD